MTGPSASPVTVPSSSPASTPAVSDHDGRLVVERTLGAIKLQNRLVEAQGGMGEPIQIGSVERLVALASAILRHATQTESARKHLADLVGSDSRRADRARFDVELASQLSSFPILDQNLPQLFHTELGAVTDRLEYPTGAPQ